ncbi:ferritin-like domain-containing protein [Nereida sp. MMG025]|uniref:ferritin-like domain-containing protein n=1 Tax=Nereida sp. MMG025 TaxID=2909981 RepID=UPI001F2C65EE|nr:ferritin-like domain-containing protein [Nereida sp. MMG025]MCF6443644.1 ferritin-like domain-containing protein [Nereida sp. MMG025]
MTTLTQMACEVLTTADAKEKTRLSRRHAKTWFEARKANKPIPIGMAEPPLRPARPAKPDLLHPRDVPRRGPGTPEGRTAMLHAVAHIELNAVDLHWDIIARFGGRVDLPIGFYDDWVKSADEESKHFGLLSDCLARYGSQYGDLDAHAGMWAAAEDTAQDLLGRLAVVPMVLEARGLDVTPGMIKLFKQAKDMDAVNALDVIYSEEVHHVAYGSKWFHYLCGRDALDPTPTFHGLVRRYFHSTLKPPFNEEKRAEAGLPPDFYWPLTDAGEIPAPKVP